jgi:hypothetical protein
VARIPLPIQEDVRDLLSDLLGRQVLAVKGEPLALDHEPGVVGSYVTGDDTVCALAAADIDFACRSGAALSMVPVVVAEESLRAGRISESLLDNTHEVINIASRLVNSPLSPHLRLARLYVTPGDLPDEIESLLARPAARRDFAVTIDGYGAGRISLMRG